MYRPYCRPPNVPEPLLHVSTFIHGRKLQIKRQSSPQKNGQKVVFMNNAHVCVSYMSIAAIILLKGSPAWKNLNLFVHCPERKRFNPAGIFSLQIIQPTYHWFMNRLIWYIWCRWPSLEGPVVCIENSFHMAVAVLHLLVDYTLLLKHNQVKAPSP